VTPTQPLAEVEPEVANVAGERRYGVRLVVAGLVVFVSSGAIRDYAKRDGVGVTSVLSFKVYGGQRAAVVECEVSTLELVKFVLGLVEGEAIRISGQLVSERGRLARSFCIRVSSIERAELQQPRSIEPR
jgi:hypothetical protein